MLDGLYVEWVFETLMFLISLITMIMWIEMCLEND